MEIARYAPSVHNTQPWMVTRTDNLLRVAIDQKHQLHDGDPTGRQTTISLGIFCESLRLAGASVGLEAVSVELVDGGATVRFEVNTSDVKLDETLEETIELLKHRASDRSIYTPSDTDEKLQNIFDSCSIIGKTTVLFKTDPAVINQVADLTGKAINVALSSPGFRNELSQYLVTQGSSKKRGIAVRSLFINPVIAFLQPFMLRHAINLGAEAKLEKLRWLSASGLVIITAPGDMPKYWIEVGQSYLRASLAIERAGLSQATSAAIVEASNYHDDVEATLGTSQRILAVIRVGAGSNKRQYSPRITAAELLGQ